MKKRNMKQIISCLLVSTMTVTLLAGCGNSGDKEKDAPKASTQKASTQAADSESKQEEPVEKEPEPVTISVGNWPSADHSSYEKYRLMKETFEAEYPYITIVPDEYKYGTDTFLAKAASGQLPNVYTTHFTECDKIIDAGYALDITDAFNETIYAETSNPDIMELVTRDGRIYGVPYEVYSMGMYYNVALFEEAGLVDENGVPLFPTTWEELKDTAITIKEKTGKAGFYFPTSGNHGGWLFTNLAWSYGVEFETLVDGKWTATFDSEEAVAALQYLMDLRWKYDVMPDDVSGDIMAFINMYGTDQVAMGLCHIPMAKSICSTTGMSKDNMAMSSVPAGPEGKAVQMGGGLFMVSPETTPEQLDAILKWLLFRSDSPMTDEAVLANYEATLQASVESGYPVGPGNGLELWVNCDRAEKEAELRAKYCNVDMNLWTAYTEHASEGLRAEPPVNAQELYAALDSVLQEALTNKNADPQALLSEAAANFQSDYLDSAN